MATVPLGELHGTAAGRAAGPAGRDRCGCGARAAAIDPDPAGGCRVRLTQADPADGEPDDTGDSPATLHADGVVLAVPPARRPGSAATAGLPAAAGWDALGYSPIVNVHVAVRPAGHDLPFAAAVDSPVQWVFDKTRQAGLPTGQYLAVSLSAADEYIDVPTATLREQFVPALARALPGRRQAPRSPISSSPGNAGLRSGRRPDAQGCARVPQPLRQG